MKNQIIVLNKSLKELQWWIAKKNIYQKGTKRVVLVVTNEQRKKQRPV